MKKKWMSLMLALAVCLGLTVPAFAADTVKVVEDETHGVRITLNGFLREETHYYNSNIWYDEDVDGPYGWTGKYTIYVVADNSTVTVEALEGRKYADASFFETMRDFNRYSGFTGGTPEYEVYQTFSNNKDQYAYESTYGYDWSPEYNAFYDCGGWAWPLEKAVTEIVSPSGLEYCALGANYEISWLCESDYAKLVPATLQTDGWAKEAMEKAFDAWIVPFSPYIVDCTRGMTRDEFAATTVMLYTAMTGKDYLELDADTEHPFTDVDWETTPYEDEVGMAYNLGLVNGTGDTAFDPKGTLTREQAAVMLSRVYAKIHGDIPAAAATGFADDSAVSSWAKAGVAFMADKGIVNGVGDGKFAPQRTLSIQEAVVMAQRMLENLK